MPPTTDAGPTHAGPGADARATRRDRRGARIALAVLVPALIAGGCGPEAVRPSAAEVAHGGPDCLAADVLWSLGLTPPEGYDRPGSRPGAVPVGFEPVAVVRCLGPLDLAATTAEPELRQTVPGLDRPAPEPRPAPEQPAATVVEAELRGDLGPLLAVLARPSQQPAPDQPCPAMWESQPVIFLVDADGRAVRAEWPTDACRFLLDGVTRPLDALEVVRETPRTAGSA